MKTPSVNEDRWRGIDCFGSLLLLESLRQDSIVLVAAASSSIYAYSDVLEACKNRDSR